MIDLPYFYRIVMSNFQVNLVKLALLGLFLFLHHQEIDYFCFVFNNRIVINPLALKKSVILLKFIKSYLL